LKVMFDASGVLGPPAPLEFEYSVPMFVHDVLGPWKKPIDLAFATFSRAINLTTVAVEVGMEAVLL